MRDLFIYHPGTGTMIALSDEVYLCDMDAIDPITYSQIENGASVSVQKHKGIQIDNFNMTNIFWGEVDE
jgi:hypothetical protein